MAITDVKTYFIYRDDDLAENKPAKLYKLSLTLADKLAVLLQRHYTKTIRSTVDTTYFDFAEKDGKVVASLVLKYD